MKVTRVDILARGLTHRCPNCGADTLFAEGKFFRANSACTVCRFNWDGDGQDGHYLRATSLNFGVTLVCFLVPLLLVAVAGWVSERTAEATALAGSLVIPVLLYRPSRSWSLMNYYILVPHELPANRACERGEFRTGEDPGNL